MGIRTRRARRNASTHGVRNAIVGALLILGLLFATLAISGGTLMASWLNDLPNYSSADAYLAPEPTEVYDINGNLIGNFYLENRKTVSMEEIAPAVVQATIDTEDIRFYSHNGIDPQGIVRAAISTVTGGREGASTITQQLVRNTVLSSERFDLTIKRKVREAYIAVELEKTYTKDQILAMYLNTIYYGHGAYGIEVASITFFNKHASELSLAEAALLAGLPQSPSYYDPIENPEAAKERRNHVLDRMAVAGDITEEEAEAAKAEDINLNPGSAALSDRGTYPYWTDYIKTLLQEDFSSDTIFQGGLKVYTTLDPAAQQAAEEAVAEQLETIGDGELNCALVAIDNETGYVKAMVGGRDYNVNQFNLATQARRQPGSSFKTFTLATALSEGMSPNIAVNCNSPLQVTPTWLVQNHYNSSYGVITMQRALELSSNTGFAQIATAIGADKIVRTAHAMGIDEELPAYPSLTLGTVGIPPIQMAEAYATIATGGIHRNAVAITRILDRNDNVVYEHKDDSERVLEAGVAYAAIQSLQGVVNYGTASVIAANNLTSQPIGGKTGTTENARDLWFVGITPQVSVAVWTGYVQEARINIWGSEGTPARSSCSVFYRYINKTLAELPRAEFPQAELPKYKANNTWTFPNTAVDAQVYEDTTASQSETNDTATSQQEATTPQNTNTGGNSGGTTTSGGGTTGENSGGSTEVVPTPVPDNSTETGGDTGGEGGEESYE